MDERQLRRLKRQEESERENQMTPTQLAHEFFLGIRTAMTCAEVSVAEYEGVMAYKIQKAIYDARAELLDGLTEIAKDASDIMLAADKSTNAGASAYGTAWTLKSKALAVIEKCKK